MKPPKKLSKIDVPKKTRKSKIKIVSLEDKNVVSTYNPPIVANIITVSANNWNSAYIPALSANINIGMNAQLPKKIIFKAFLSPGDIVMLTAAIRDLHKAHPGKYITDVRTNSDTLWENNPYITKLDENAPDVELIPAHYPLINQSNASPYHFIHGYRMYLEQILGVSIPATDFKGDIHISAQEKTWMSQVQEITNEPTKFWLIVSGGKYDFTAKWWNPARFQAVVDAFQGKIQFVQVGEAGHNHPPLNGVINLVGKTDTRQMARLMYHADGVVCGVTFLMHLAAAVETKPGMPKQRPAVIIAGGREPSQWEAYPSHTFLHTIGALRCCDSGGCWKSRVIPLGDNDHKDKSLCVVPTASENKIVIPKCMDMIKASDVIAAINRYLEFK